jgi:hexosaminidase
LEIRPKLVQISALHPASVFYGVQSLQQLVPVEIEENFLNNIDWVTPCEKIGDYPLFSWCGLMLGGILYNFNLKK